MFRSGRAIEYLLTRSVKAKPVAEAKYELVEKLLQHPDGIDKGLLA